jgi:hypothetical protein
MVMGTSDAYPVNGPILSAVATTNRFRALDGCSAQSQSGRAGSAGVQTWSSCSGGSAVRLVVIQGGHHTWPYLAPPGAAASGNPDAQFSASQAIWAFLSAHRLESIGAAVRLSSLRVKKTGHQRAVVASFGLDEPVSVRVTVGSHKLASKQFKLARGAQMQVTVKVPGRSKAGQYTVTFVILDSYGRQLKLARTIRLPSR